MSSDFVVDYALLEKVENTLNSLHREFGDIQAQEQGYSADWGSGDIASAMNGFATNWDYHRSQMLKSMESLCTDVHTCRTETARHDSRLKSGLPKNK